VVLGPAPVTSTSPVEEERVILATVEQAIPPMSAESGGTSCA
jgi:hypothetical protein